MFLLCKKKNILMNLASNEKDKINVSNFRESFATIWTAKKLISCEQVHEYKNTHTQMKINSQPTKYD